MRFELCFFTCFYKINLKVPDGFSSASENATNELINKSVPENTVKTHRSVKKLNKRLDV